MGILDQTIGFVKHLIFDIFVVVSACMALVKVIAIEWRDLRRHFRR
jgi:hypothetical protein